MAKANSEGSWIFFLIIFLTVAMIVAAGIRSANTQKRELQEKAFVTSKLISLSSDVGIIKANNQAVVNEAEQSKIATASMLSKLDVFDKRITTLETKNVSETKEIIEQYVPTAYCLTEYDNLTKMIIMKCKDYPVQIIR